MVLFQSGLGTAFSGSFAGLNFAHGPGGQYFRAKAFGVNPWDKSVSYRRHVSVQQ